MHGAGMAHLFNTAVGEPNCCGLVELFPERSMGFGHITGNANMAGFLGLAYARYQVETGRTNPQAGTKVDIPVVVSTVTATIGEIIGHSICMHNVRDSTNTVVFPTDNMNSMK